MSTNFSKRQNEIINTAIKLIGVGGIQALTIKNLSAEIGIVESAIYRHFKSKIEILNVLIDFLKNIISTHYSSTYELKISSLEKIKKMISGQLKIFAENPPYATVILSDGLFINEKELHAKIFSIMERAKLTYINIINEGKKSGEIRKDISSEQLAFIIMGSVRLIINQWSLSSFNFDLQKRGINLYKTLNILIHS